MSSSSKRVRILKEIRRRYLEEYPSRTYVTSMELERYMSAITERTRRTPGSERWSPKQLSLFNDCEPNRWTRPIKGDGTNLDAF